MKRRYNITLTPEMDEKLNQVAYLTRKSRSALIEEALDKFLAAPDECSRSSHDEISTLKERMELLEAKILNLETKGSEPRVFGQKNSMEVQKNNGLKVQRSGQCKTSQLISSPPSAEDPILSAIALDPNGWYTQSLVSEFLDQSVLISTRKSIVSLAVARGEMETNGKKRKGCRIKGSSAIKWITSMRKKDKPPVFFLGSQS